MKKKKEVESRQAHSISQLQRIPIPAVTVANNDYQTSLATMAPGL